MPDPITDPATPSAIATASATPALSPTGTPWLSPKVMKIIGLVVAILLAVLGVLTAAYPQQHVFALAFALVTAVGAVFGIASPGIRTPTVGLLLCCAIALVGCTPIEKRQAIVCAEDAGAKVLADAPAIVSALAGENYQVVLDKLLADLGPAVLCEGQVLLEVLRGAASPTPMLAETPYQQNTTLKAARLGVWLNQHKADYK